MQKGVQIAFAITLVVLSIVSMIWRSNMMEDIVYAVVIPSFILTVISFASDISSECEKNAQELAESSEKLFELSQKMVNLKMEKYKYGCFEGVPFVEDLVPKEIVDDQVEGLKHVKEANAYRLTQIIFAKSKRFCDRFSIVGYVALFLSLCLSPVIMSWLSAINLNCITLWSLSVLYITIELKADICNWLFIRLHKWQAAKYTKRLKDSKNDSDQV